MRSNNSYFIKSSNYIPVPIRLIVSYLPIRRQPESFELLDEVVTVLGWSSSLDPAQKESDDNSHHHECCR